MKQRNVVRRKQNKNINNRHVVFAPNYPGPKVVGTVVVKTLYRKSYNRSITFTQQLNFGTLQLSLM